MTPAPEAHGNHVDKLARDVVSDLLRYFERRVIQRHEAHDLVSETLLGLYSKPERIPADATKARMWCFGIARNVLRNFYTRSTRSRALHECLAQRALVDIKSVEDSILAHETTSALATALSSLDFDERECLLLIAVDGLSVDEAAERLGVDEATASSWHSVTLERLRERLGAAGVGATSQPSGMVRP